MIILSAKDIAKAYGEDVILKDVSFNINKGDRVGVIGINGAGKTTLLDILAGRTKAESGDFFVSEDTTIGYLKQKDDFSPEGTVIEQVEKIFSHFPAMEKEMEMLAKEIAGLAGSPDQEPLLTRYDRIQHEFMDRGGYLYKSEIKGVLSSMAFGPEMYQKTVSTLSGGEKTRLALASLLLEKPDMLFLDEPTNHLDIGTINWLEQYLKSYKGTILIVSHDRYFLDRTVNRIFEIENHRLFKYEGGYDGFAEKKRLKREVEFRHYQNTQKQIKKQEEIIRRFKGHGTEKLAKRAASREKMLARMEKPEAPAAGRSKIKISFKEKFKSGKDVVLAEGLSKAFGHGSNKKTLFEGLDVDIKRGERICIVGQNGIGKTTFMRMLTGEIEPDSGYIKNGHNVSFGYYDQGQQRLSPGNTVLEELKEAYRLYSDTEMRSILGRFLFRGDAVFLKVGALSGGEKARLALLKLMLSGDNVLLLDEPTNHLDIDSREIFEDALVDFPGTVMAISHDRYFLKKIPDRILELTDQGFVEFLGNYDYYAEKKKETGSGSKYLDELKNKDRKVQEKERGNTRENIQEEEPGKREKAPDPAEERKMKKQREAEERRLQREKKATEQEIEMLEKEIGDLEKQMCGEEAQKNLQTLENMGERLSQAKEELTKKYQKWLQYHDS